MKKNTFIFLFTLAFSSLVAQPSDSYILNLMDTCHIPGVETVIVKDGKWKWERQWGLADIPNNIPVQREDVFLMGSISKTIIATALMQLWEQGAFQLDDDVNLYLPFQVHHPAYPNDAITIRMLTGHTSGIYDDFAWSIVNGDSPVPLGTFLFDYLDPSGAYYDVNLNFTTFQPGTGSEYSNIGSALAAYIVEQISGIPFDQYCDQNIFQPLCMDNTAFKISGFSDTSIFVRPYTWNEPNYNYDDYGHLGVPIYPAGWLRTTLTSLAKFMDMYMQYGTFENTQILDSATVALMMTPQYTNIPSEYVSGIFFYQYPMPNGDSLWGHAGATYGCSTDMFFNYTNKTGVIVFGNGSFGNCSVDPIFEEVYNYGITLPAALPTDSFPSCLLPTGITAHANYTTEISLFPNPANDVLHVELKNSSEQIEELTVLNMYGKTVIEENKLRSKSPDLYVKELAPGIYIIHIKTNKSYCSYKFIKN